MSKETYAEAFEVWHKSDLVLRGDDYYDVLGFMQDADREIERLEAENAAQREKLEAANKRADAAVEEICLKCHTRAAEFNLEVKSEHCAQCKWRGGQEGAE